MDNNDKIITEVKKGRGRPPLSPKEKEARHRETKRKYRESHKEQEIASAKIRGKKARELYLTVRVPILRELTPTLERIVAETNMKASKLFLSAVEEKYGIKLS